MGRKLDVGYRVSPYAIGQTSLTYTPLADRAGIIRSISVDGRSADDTWRLSVGGREIMVFRENSVGQQQLLKMAPAATSRVLNVFDWARNVLGLDMSIPVPWGQSAVLKSDGGSNAQLLMEVEEHDPGDISVSMLNHYAGSTFLIPLILQRAAAIPAAVVADASLDTQFSPAWMPKIILGTMVPPNWKIELLALFLEGGGVNTFSGAANHQSITASLELIKTGEYLFTHSFPDGLANLGNGAAAGSANAVLTQVLGFVPPFQQSELDQGNVIDAPVVLNVGDNLDVKLHFNAGGDTTGTADYSKFLQVFLARVTRPSGP